MQRMGKEQGDAGSQKNAAGEHNNRDTKKIAYQSVQRGQTEFTDNFSLVQDSLHRGFREEPFADDVADFILTDQTIVMP